MTENGANKLKKGSIATLRLELRPWRRGLALRILPHGVFEGATGLPVVLHRGFGFWKMGDYATLARIVTNSSAAVG